MPTYVYECAKCGDEFEQWQSFSDEPLKKHSGCGGKVVKVLQPVGILLKGPGFYRTDSRSAGKNGHGKDATKSDRGEKSDRSSKSESSSSDAPKSDSSTSTSESTSDKKTEKKSDSAKQPSTSTGKSS